MEGVKRKAEGEGLASPSPLAKPRVADEEANAFSNLSLELLLLIFSFLDLKDVPKVCLICSAWRQLIESDWKSRYLQRWPCRNPAGLTRLLPLAPKVVVQPKETWACPQCTLINQPDAQYCEVCDGEKPDEEILRALRESEQPAQPTSQQEPEEVPQETSLAPKWKDLYRERRAAEIDDPPATLLDRAFVYYVRQKGIDGLVKLRIYEAASIRRLKYSITDATGIPPEIQKLYYTEPSSGRKEELAVSYQHQMRVFYGPNAGQTIMKTIDNSLLRYGISNRSVIDLTLLPCADKAWTEAAEGLTVVPLTDVAMENALYKKKVEDSERGYETRMSKHYNSRVGVWVKTLTGKTVTVPIGPECCVSDLILRIQDLEGIPPDQQRIIWQGQEISKCAYETLGYFDVVADSLVSPTSNASTLHLVLRLRGD